eukprot:10585924-Alexandrium_andersonii.AAC.1
MAWAHARQNEDGLHAFVGGAIYVVHPVLNVNSRHARGTLRHAVRTSLAKVAAVSLHTAH